MGREFYGFQRVNTLNSKDPDPMPSIDRLDPSTDPGKNRFVGKYGKYEIESATYPANNHNDHFVRFYINIDDESRLIRENKVTVVGDVDRTDQNRASRGNTSQTRANVLAAGAGGTAGFLAGAQLSRASQNSQVLLKNLQGWKGGVGRAVGGFAANNPKMTRILGAGAGAGVGLLAASTLNLTKTLKRLGATITLYTPQDIATSYTMNWDAHESDIADLMSKDRGEEFLSNLGPGTKDGLATKLTRLIATNASRDIQLLSRTTKNPKKDFLFRDVEKRTFRFEYMFAPQSPKEAEEVARIIYMFKLFSHPELLEGYDNFLYIYPAEFDIVYGYKQQDQNGNEISSLEQTNPYLHKISSCVLRSIQLNYSAGGTFQTLRRGEPCMVRMALDFAEIESLHQGRIEEGY
jgi:hypothetical protein